MKTREDLILEFMLALAPAVDWDISFTGNAEIVLIQAKALADEYLENA